MNSPCGYLAAVRMEDKTLNQRFAHFCSNLLKTFQSDIQKTSSEQSENPEIIVDYDK
jgi:hypothetical protein